MAAGGRFGAEDPWRPERLGGDTEDWWESGIAALWVNGASLSFIGCETLLELRGPDRFILNK